MNSLFCEWCEKKRDTVMIFVEKDMDEYCSLCHSCAISYYKDQVCELEAEKFVLRKMERMTLSEFKENPQSPYKEPKAITGTHCF